MKKLVTNIIDKLRQFLSRVWTECRDARTLAIFLVVVFLMYTPTWGGYLMHALFGWKTGSVIASAYTLFWAGPFTPFFPVCLAITFAIKRKMEQKDRESGYRWHCLRRRLWFVKPIPRSR